MAGYVQYGCGLSCPESWVNYDASPTLRLQRLPGVGRLLASRLSVVFPDAVQFGDIVEGLPVQEKSCEAVYCSHVLEHLSLDDFRTALSNTFAILRPGGLFRLVMPDLEVLARTYLEDLDAGSEGAAMAFMRGSGMALSSRPQSLRSKLASSLGNTRHQWLWDVPTAVAECERAGFEKVRRCSFGDSAESKFGEVEDEQRFIGAVSLEMTRS